MIITIDGPAASKSSVARLLAQQLGYYYINSGLLYRALAYLLYKNADHTLPLTFSERDIDALLKSGRLQYDCDKQANLHIKFNGDDITAQLKTGPISNLASQLSTNPYLREQLLQFQRQIAAHHDVIVEGRDSGTVVFPHADIKFFLTAPLAIRARRWQYDQDQRGNSMSEQEAYEQVRQRDKRDSERAVAPLQIPEGAHVIDNGDYSIEETVQLMIEQI